MKNFQEKQSQANPTDHKATGVQQLHNQTFWTLLENSVEFHVNENSTKHF